MPRNIEHYKQLLQARESELTEEVSRFQEDAREARTAEVEDPIDEATSSQAKAAAFGVSSVASDTLNMVRAALQRIEAGTYGTCVDCGREIDEKRLEAVPWALYCIEDQEKHDREAAQHGALHATM